MAFGNGDVQLALPVAVIARADVLYRPEAISHGGPPEMVKELG